MIFLAAMLAGAMWRSDPQSSTTALPVMFDAPYVLHTEIRKSVRRDSQSPVIASQSWEVRVSPTDDGFITVWRDLTKRQSLTMEIETNDSLRPVRIVNLTEIRRSIAEALNVDDKDDEGRLAMSFLNALPEPTLVGLLTEDASMIALGQGRLLAVGQPYRYSTQSQPFATGPSVANDSTYELESVDEDAGRAVVLWTTSIDAKALAAVLPDFMRAAMGAMGLDTSDQSKVAEAVAGAVMAKTSRCRYEIVIRTGLAETASCVTLLEVEMLGQRSKTETRFEATQRVQR